MIVKRLFYQANGERRMRHTVAVRGLGLCYLVSRYLGVGNLFPSNGNIVGVARQRGTFLQQRKKHPSLYEIQNQAVNDDDV